MDATIWKEEVEQTLPALKKLALIQKELFVPKANKNDFGKYNYRSCEDILVAVKPLCEKYNCVLRINNYPFWQEGRHYVKTTVILTDLETGAKIENYAMAREEENKKGMDESQITGAAISYSRKYALAGLFCIDNEKDSDATNRKRKDGSEEVTNDSGETEVTLTATQIDAIYAELERTGISAEAVCGRYKKPKIEQMTQKDYVAAIKSLNATPDKEKGDK